MASEEQTVNLRGLKCPLPALRTKKALRGKTAGDVIGAALVEEGEAILPGLGKLVTQQQAERAGINPKTGAPLIIAARKAVKFKVAKALKDAVAA